MNLTVIIVDDEIRSQRLIEAYLEKFCPEVEVLAKAENVAEAVLLIRSLQPDLVFLDIEMPGENGFGLLNYFTTLSFKIIFITAYQEFALKAFKVSAIDYLLKPLQAAPLIKAIEKAKSQLHKDDYQKQIEILKSNLLDQQNIQKLALPVANGYRYVQINDISYLEADGSYTHIHLANGQSILITKKLGELEALIQHSDLFKTHRSYLINLRYVKQYVRSEGGYILMQNDTHLPIARARKDAFLEKMKAIL